MILTLVGLSQGMLNDAVKRARGVNADIWVKPPGTSAISFSSAGMNEKLVPFFRSQPHITEAAGMIIHPVGGVSTITGLDLDSFNAVSGGFTYLQGGPFQGPDDVIIDDWYARQANKRLGDKINILNRDWRVCGIVEAGKLARVVVPMRTLQDLTGNPGKLSQILLKLDNSANTPAVIAALKEQLPDYQIWSIEEFASMFSVNNVPGLKAFINVIIGLSIVVGFLVVSLTMYAAVLERTREIGILKALGASPGDVMTILVRETLLLAAAGWVIGLLLTFAAIWAINTFVRASLQAENVPAWWPVAAGIAVIAALLGAVYPGLRAARQDAIEALAYE